ncbi:hypothetical protein BU25DRAFT_417073 [Macroventuria anomochaeta]|uniref:Uncharacterized protein n=1 Tax=Macroventuria anomochaeta TaxID=301207 RepID=A0ACB6SIS7_9PLEO|nr:uncharacterized protein BU25DRAFT_417073 [Macroventuria anomochaeta]KAF2633948.1 hypothetical protein BU25DRAFT_417073 [Macroventuria anomochaeta]
MEAIDLANEMKLWQKVPEIKNDNMRKAREFPAWGYVLCHPLSRQHADIPLWLWLWTTMYTYYYMRPPLLPPPDYEVPNPDLDPEWYGEVWVRYCQNSVRTPILLDHNFRETTRLRLIQADIGTAMFGKLNNADGLSYEQALIFKARLGAWLHALPEPLSASKVVYPGHISLHLEYHGTCLALFRTHQQNSCDAVAQAKIGLETLCVFASSPQFRYLRRLSVQFSHGLKSQASHYYLGSLTYRVLRNLMNPDDVSRLGSSLSLKGNEEDEQMAADHI